jgi:hypothetical protein
VWLTGRQSELYHSAWRSFREQMRITKTRKDESAKAEQRHFLVFSSFRVFVMEFRLTTLDGTSRLGN